MRTFFKFLLTLIAIAIIFAGGYWLGHRGTGAIRRMERSGSGVKKFITGTESRVGQSVADVQIKWHKQTAGRQVEKALSQYEQHNYGNAETAVREARGHLEKWAELAPAEGAKIKPEIRALAEIEGLIRKESPRAREALDATKKHIEKL